MKIRMHDTTTSQVAKRITQLREKSGVVALGRVLTLVISTDDAGIESAVQAANAASLEHPCRIIVLALGDPAAPTRLDAEIRVGGDAGASDVVVLWCAGENAHAGESLVSGLLLPDAPIVAWWPGNMYKNRCWNASPAGWAWSSAIARRRLVATFGV